MPNENCLEGMQCPKCGCEGPFTIGIKTTVLMTDEGSEDDPMGADQEWDDDSYCGCCEESCPFSGTVKDFRAAEGQP
jgi:hypothetical protein